VPVHVVSVAAGGGSQQRISRGRALKGLAATAVPGAKEARRMVLSLTAQATTFFFSRAPELCLEPSGSRCYQVKVGCHAQKGLER
jgi:hypothetical protein